MTGLKQDAPAHVSLLCDFTLWEKTCGKRTQTLPNEIFVGEEHEIKPACEQSAALVSILYCLHVLGFSSAAGRLSEVTLQPSSR